MTRIVTTTYRYKRPPGTKKAVALAVPNVVTAKGSRRPIREKATAAEVSQMPRPERAMQPSTPRTATRIAPPANDDQKSATVTTSSWKRRKTLYEAERKARSLLARSR